MPVKYPVLINHYIFRHRFSSNRAPCPRGGASSTQPHQAVNTLGTPLLIVMASWTYCSENSLHGLTRVLSHIHAQIEHRSCDSQLGVFHPPFIFCFILAWWKMFQMKKYLRPSEQWQEARIYWLTAWTRASFATASASSCTFLILCLVWPARLSLSRSWNGSSIWCAGQDLNRKQWR